MRALTTGLAILAMAGSSFAATRKVPQQYDTIQEAVDAAEAGDTIKIAPGTYHENVSFEGKDGLKFVGKKVIWDGSNEGEPSYCLSASANGISVTGIKFRNGYPALSIGGNDLTVQKCVFVNSWDWSVSMEGSNFRFLKNTVQGSYRGVNASSDDAVLQKNVFRNTYDTHVQVYGNRTDYSMNRNGGFYDEGDTVYLNGNEVVASRNTLRNNYGIAIYVDGDDAFLQKNTVQNGYNGIRVDGNGATVDANSFRSFYQYVLQLYGSENVATGNKLSDSYDSAVYVSGDGNQILHNSIDGINDADAIQMYGVNGSIEDNVILLCYGGIRTDGPGHHISGNRITDTWGDGGIRVFTGEFESGGVIIENNTVTDVIDHGIYVNTDGATLTSNTVTRSGTYYYAAFYVAGNSNTLESNTAVDAGEDGFRIGGSSNSLTTCISRNAVINGFRVNGTSITLDGCESTGSDGQGIYNSGPSTTVTDSTFTGNALDVANNGTLVGGTGGMTFDTGGESQSAHYFSYND